MPAALVNRQDHQGHMVQWLWDWRGRNSGFEEFPDGVGEIYERLISIWEDMQSPDKISDSNVRKEHAAKFGISYNMALKDYQDSFLFHGFEPPEFRKGYKQRNLERYERLFNFAVTKNDIKLAAQILEKIDNLLQLNKIEEGDKALSEKLRARVVPIILTQASQALVDKLSQDGGLIDLSDMTKDFEDITYEDVE